MKKIAAIALFITIFMASQGAHARMSNKDLNRSAPMTNRDALLMQLDIGSLYLTSPRMAYAPRLKGNKVEVELTVLDYSLVEDRSQLVHFLQRHMTVFVNLLNQRLKLYAPSLASHFNYQTDLAFVINKGPQRQSVAHWSGGSLTWATGESVAMPLAVTETGEMNIVEDQEPAPKSHKGCCPALRN